MSLEVRLASRADEGAVAVIFVSQKSSPKNSDIGSEKKSDPPALQVFHPSRGVASYVDQLAKADTFKAGFKSTFYFPETPASLKEDIPAPGVLFVGLGNLPSNATELAEVYRRAGAVVTKTLNANSVKKAVLDLRTLAAKKLDPALQLAEGAMLAHYSFQQYRKKPKPPKLESLGLGLNTNSKKTLDKELERIRILVEATHFARDLGNLPGNDLIPEVLADKAVAMAKKVGVKATVLGKAEILKEKLTLLWAVGRGTVNLPRLIVLEYNASKKNAPHLCLIGKGLTFDSGGISIKPAGGMEEMKFDMCGSAAVLGATMAIAQLKLPLRVTTIVATAENMSGDDAIRPGDIFISHKGLSVEITNTDAEGRLVLADALSYAQRYFKPDAIVDAATLTGACVVALGGAYAGMMGNNAKLIDQVKQASEDSGEPVWELPLSPYYEADMDSPYADVRNSGNRNAGSSKGGIFLRRFIDEGQAWAHLDIAGISDNVGHFDYHGKHGASGVMVRLFTRLAENFKKT